MTNQDKIDKLAAKMPTLLEQQAKREEQQRQRLANTLARLEALPERYYNEMVRLYAGNPMGLYNVDCHGLEDYTHSNRGMVYTERKQDIAMAKQEREVILYQLMMDKQLVQRELAA